jgi:hypothetical protein
MRWFMGAAATLGTVGCLTSGDRDRIDALEADADALGEQLGMSSGDDESVEKRLQSLASEIARLTDENDDLAARLAAAEAALEGHRGQLVAIEAVLPEGGWASIGSLDAALAVGTHGDTTRDVTFGTIRDALHWLAGFRVGAEAEVTIHVPPGAWTYDEPIDVRHPDGNRIRIRGAGSNIVELVFTGAAGVVVDHGAALREIDGVTLIGTPSLAGQFGVLGRRGGAVTLGPDVVVQDFGGTGVFAWSGVVSADGVSSNDNGGHGFAAVDGGVLHASGASAARNAGAGFTASVGGVVRAPDAVATENERGLSAHEGGVLHAEDAEVVDSVGDGIGVFGAATAVVDRVEVSGSGGDGLQVGNAGFVRAVDASVTSSAENGVDVSGLGAAVADGIQVADSVEFGVKVHGASYLEADDAVVSRGGGDGVHATDRSFVRATRTKSEDNPGHGFLVQWDAMLWSNQLILRGDSHQTAYQVLHRGVLKLGAIDNPSGLDEDDDSGAAQQIYVAAP